MDEIAGRLPWVVAALLLVGGAVVASRFPRARAVIAAMRPALRRRLTRLPRLRLVVTPPPEADEHGQPAPGTALPTDPSNPGGGPTGGMG